MEEPLSSLLTQVLADGILQSCGGQPNKAFHTWRRQTATLIHALPLPEDDVGTHVDGLVSIVESKLKDLVPDWPGSLRKSIQEIILSAIHLDCDLSQQCAYWYARYPNRDPVNWDIEFDDTAMKVPANHAPEQFLALMISPALYKAGNSRGERYGQCEVAYKSEVICLAPLPPSPPPPPPPPPLRDYYELPAGVPKVVDEKTEMARQQYASYKSLKEARREASKGQKVIGFVAAIRGWAPKHVAGVSR
jgi:hypothetical protein